MKLKGSRCKKIKGKREAFVIAAVAFNKNDYFYHALVCCFSSSVPSVFK